MKKLHKKIWDLSVPYLEKGVRKDFVVHTKGVIRAMQILLENEECDKDILIASAITHDVGWSKVPEDIQLNWRNKQDKKKGKGLHIKYAGLLIKEILTKVNYKSCQIQEVIEIVESHESNNVSTLEKQLLIDADAMSDGFKEQFYSDVKEYKKSPRVVYYFRRNNKFYTKTAKRIFEKELEQRKKEFQSG